MTEQTITDADIATIGGYEMMTYLREIAPEHFKDLLEWQLAMFVRGIITQSELFAHTGELSDAELFEDIAALKRSTARWIAA